MDYIDYNELSEEKKKALYEEFLSAYAEERKLSRVFRFAPLGFGAGIIALVVASLVLYFLSGIGIAFIIMLSATLVALLIFIIFKIKLDKVRFAHSARYAAWLRDVKHVIAELKQN